MQVYQILRGELSWMLLTWKQLLLFLAKSLWEINKSWRYFHDWNVLPVEDGMSDHNHFSTQSQSDAERHKNSCSIKIQPTPTCFTQNQSLFYGETVKYRLKTLLNSSNLTICVASTNMFASLCCTDSNWVHYSSLMLKSRKNPTGAWWLVKATTLPGCDPI